ncbi:MAG: M43 family zinc metalloprotease [Bacteroidota bacterium]
MKKISFLVFNFILSLNFIAQTPECGQHLITESVLKKHPKLRSKVNELNNNFKINTVSVVNYTIPVVFHILHTGGAECISDAQVLSQMAILNRDYQKQNSDTINVVPSFTNNIANVGIAFKLATIDPNGNCTNGIIRHYDSNTIWDPNNLSLFIYSWPRDKYLNIYVVKSIIGINGAYTFLPGTPVPPNCDAIACMHNYVGNTGTTLGVDYRVLTHEVGHWFNLQHTWGSTNNPMVACGDDGVTDTPVTKGFVSCATSNAAICTPSVQENVQNYMDYAPCKLMFTNGQKNRMLTCLTSNINNRNNLYTPGNLAQTGITTTTSNCIPKIDVASSTKSVCVGKTVTINSYTSNANPITYNWSVSGPAIASSFTNSSLTITTTAIGNITVTCVASNTNGSSSSNYVLTALTTSVVSPGNYAESFEGNSLPANWLKLTNNSNSSIWATTNLAASLGGKSMMIDGALTTAGTNEILETPSYDLNANPGVSYTLKYAYARKNLSQQDFFIAQGSKDCGGTWQTIQSINSANLSSGSGGTTSSPFVPAANQWKLYDLSAHPNFNNYINESNVKFRFIFRADSINGLSNNFFLDEINLNSAVSINEKAASVFLNVSPNPFKSEIKIQVNLLQAENFEVVISNLLGQTLCYIENKTYYPGKNELHLSDLERLTTGVYFIQLKSKEKIITKKLIKE